LRANYARKGARVQFYFLSMYEEIIKEFGLDTGTAVAVPIHQGLINTTWKVTTPQAVYILQKINHHVFKTPEDIDANIRLMADHLQQTHPDYLFTVPVPTRDGRTIVYEEQQGYFRMFPFIPGTHTKDTVQTSDEAYEAARQFGKFTAVLKGLDVSKLRLAIPGFHDLGTRFNQFINVIKRGDEKRKLYAAELIRQSMHYSHIADEYKAIQEDSRFRLRATHHDTKISNVLFNENNRGVCVIDLDTVMPGYFISDTGDMMRTYLCPVSEEEHDLSRIEIRTDIYHAIVQGYLDEMKDDLTGKEKKYFFYAGAFMIYMQALRFLADYLSGDKYYAITHPQQNFDRAANQMRLLKQFMDLKEILSNRS
jgi:Ser/Thr protein kinase RdoA (MazF antagonist)